MKTSEAVLVALVASAFAAGTSWVLAQVGAAEEPSNEQPSVESLGTSEVLARLESLQRAVSSLQLPTEGRAEPTQLVEPLAAQISLLATKVDELDARLEHLATSVARAAPAAAGPGSASPGDALEVPQDLPDAPVNEAALSEYRGRLVSEMTSKHSLWTYEQVAEAYGHPSELGPSPNGKGVRFYYQLSDGSELAFYFVGGVVSTVYWND